MEMDHHRLSIRMTSVASENGLLWLVPSVPAEPTNVRNRHNLAIDAGIDEGLQSTRNLSYPEIKTYAAILTQVSPNRRCSCYGPHVGQLMLRTGGKSFCVQPVACSWA
jgi:hypothetical protein